MYSVFQSRDFFSEKNYCQPCWCTTFQWKPRCPYERLLYVKWFYRFVGLSWKNSTLFDGICSNKSGKVKGVSFHRVPAVVTRKGEFMEELTRERIRSNYSYNYYHSQISVQQFSSYINRCLNGYKLHF